MGQLRRSMSGRPVSHVFRCKVLAHGSRDTSGQPGKMNIVQQLHNAARSYCITRHAHWCSEYRSLPDRGGVRAGTCFADKARDTFPRYNILSAILADIERLDPDSLPEFSVLTELLILSGHTAQSLFTEKPGPRIHPLPRSRPTRSTGSSLRTGSRGFWFPESLHWIMYASHENSMTTGGILTDAIFRCWPGASEHLW